MTEKNSKDEIDILSLFSKLSKKTNSLLVLIINTFISILNLILSLLNMVKKNYLVLLICTMIGALTGYFYEKNLYVPQYQTTLTLSPNFGSTYHLYENIKFYQSLISQKDFEKLNVYLNIDSTELKSILSISIKPYKNESLNLKNFKKLLNTADSVTALTLSYDKFVDKIPFESYSLHVLTLKTTKSEIPSQLEESIVESLENNKYYLNEKNTYIENLEIKKKYIGLELRKIDTFLFAKNKPFNDKNLGTTILFEKSQYQNIQLELFDKYTSLRNELIEINYQFKNKQNVINTIDSFEVLGELNNKRRFKLYGALILFSISLFLITINAIFKSIPDSFKLKKLDLSSY